jgi:hypothetical protein
MKHIITLPLLLLLAACTNTLINYDINTNTPVVESYITLGDTTITLRLYTIEAYLKDDYQLSKPITAQQIQINGLTLTETTPGTYTLNLHNTIQPQQTYTLNLTYNQTQITATTQIPTPITNLNITPATIQQTNTTLYYPSTTDTTTITLTWDNPDNAYHQLYIQNPTNTNTTPTGSNTNHPRRIIQPFRGNTYTTTTRDFHSTGTYHITLYRLNTEYANLYEHAAATDLPNPTSAITNALGIFTAISTAQITLTVTNTEE